MSLKKKLSAGAIFATGLLIAEIATVILCGSGIFLPKFIGILRRKPRTALPVQRKPVPQAGLPRSVSFKPLINGDLSDPGLPDANRDGIGMHPRADLETASRQDTLDDYHMHVRQMQREDGCN
ncbi:MAG: hypothetical protein Q9220_007004 [cf. Caloplaca sp. 1 TL-2023]